jgi:hypothetical protein
MISGGNLLRIQSDEPVAIDALDREKFAFALAKVVETCDTPLVIGLYGTWGIGKTSLMRQIEAALHESLHVRTVWFDPWQHQFDEDPAVALLHTMVSQLGLGDEGKKILTVIAAALGSVLLKATTTLNADDLQRLGERYEEERFQVREKQVRLREYFGALIEHASENGKHRLVFIDDLDRCVPELVLKVLEALKLYLSLPNCVFVLGVDRSALECSIRHRYKDQEIREADYLDKIVQLPFTIPPIVRESMKRFVGTLLEGPLATATDLLVAGLGDNPRQVKRFVNTLLLNHELAAGSFGEGYDARMLAAVLVIQYRRPDLFKAATSDPGILVSLARGGEQAEPYADFIKNDPRLQDVISQARFTKPERVAPYIYLSEIAGVRVVAFDVVMTAVGPNKINVIKAIREHIGLGLKESKDLVDSPLPVTMGSDLPREAAEGFAQSLRAAGATAALE